MATEPVCSPARHLGRGLEPLAMVQFEGPGPERAPFPTRGAAHCRLAEIATARRSMRVIVKSGLRLDWLCRRVWRDNQPGLRMGRREGPARRRVPGSWLGHRSASLGLQHPLDLCKHGGRTWRTMVLSETRPEGRPDAFSGSAGGPTVSRVPRRTHGRAERLA